MEKEMTIADAIADLKRELKESEMRHAIMQEALGKLHKHLEILRANVEILQDVFLKKSAIPTRPNPFLN